MTRKHYVKIAQALLDSRPGGGFSEVKRADQWREDVVAIAKVLADDNPRFDAGRFYAAAGF